MKQSIYILTAEPRSGKTVVVLGMMDALYRQARRVGFFRPVIRTGVRDSSIDLIAGRYGLPVSYEEMYGCTYKTAWELITADKDDELVKLVLEKYKALEAQCDLIVCSGSDFTGVAAALEFGVNADLANNLGCLVLPVAKGQGRSVREVVGAVQGIVEGLEEKKCDLLGVVVNRVASKIVDEVATRLRETMPKDVPAYVLPEITILGKPTVGEIARALNAEIVSGGEEALNREVTTYRVAAMELPHFLDYLQEGMLVITPGDRADIILGSLLADASRTYPRVGGLLLTGNFKPAPSVQRLIDGLRKSPVPILSAATDTFSTAIKVSSLEGTLVPENSRKIAAALGIMEARVNFAELHKHLSTSRPIRVTPLMFEYDLVQRAKGDRRHIVLPEGAEERILRAAEILLLREVVDLTLLGNPDEIRQKIGDLGLRLDRANIVDPLKSERRELYAETYYELRKHKGISQQMAFDVVSDVSYFGTMMVHHGEADGMVSGSIHTTQHTIRPAFEIIKTKPGCSIVSSVFFMCLVDRVLVFGDCAVNPDPRAEELADIAISSAETALMFGVEPRVAMLSYSTGESGKGSEVDKVREATQIAKGLRPDLKIEGPLQYDAAVDETVARLKAPGSDVAGHATVFIFPDLNTGNNTYKAVQRSANAVAVGPVLQGLNKPVNDLSRGCTVTDIVNTVAITAIQAQEAKR